jgi:hypothetical protein
MRRDCSMLCDIIDDLSSGINQIGGVAAAERRSGSDRRVNELSRRSREKPTRSEATSARGAVQE